MLAVTIPEVPGSFVEFVDTALNATNIQVTEFKYRSGERCPIPGGGDSRPLLPGCSPPPATKSLYVRFLHLYTTAPMVHRLQLCLLLNPAHSHPLAAACGLTHPAPPLHSAEHRPATATCDRLPLFTSTHPHHRRYSSQSSAHVLFGIEAPPGSSQCQGVIDRLNAKGMATMDISELELAQVCVCVLAGGRGGGGLGGWLSG